MLAIETRFHGPTNHRGSRITASVTEKSRDGEPQRRITVECDDRLGIEENHRAAIKALINKCGWNSMNGYNDWFMGGTERGYVAVCALDYARIYQPMTESKKGAA